MYAGEMRAAVDAFVDLYNEQRLREKSGFLSPRRCAKRGTLERSPRKKIRVQRSGYGTLELRLQSNVSSAAVSGPATTSCSIRRRNTSPRLLELRLLKRNVNASK
jgi:hypothetical protein